MSILDISNTALIRIIGHPLATSNYRDFTVDINSADRGQKEKGKIENYEYNSNSQKILVNIFQKVKLLAKYPLRVSSKALRQATKAVFGLPAPKAIFKLTSKLLPEIFSVSELASSRGQGIRTKKGVDLRPVLDQHRVQILKGISNVFVLSILINN